MKTKQDECERRISSLTQLVDAKFGNVCLQMLKKMQIYS